MTITRLPPTEDGRGEGPLGFPEGDAPEPGLLLIFSGGEPRCTPIPIGAEEIELGREHPALVSTPDGRMSRKHARVAHRDGDFLVTDLGGRNGSQLDGADLRGSVRTSRARVLRLGQSLFLFCADVGPVRRLGVRIEGQRVEGPSLQRTIASIATAAPLSRTLFIGGESGSGKEWLAGVFHRSGPQRDGPFVPVNCAAIPEGIAERLLFGAVKGAYSGASADSEGTIQAASGGTLFLDEIGDVDPGVQAKLLRVLESGEVTPLGATRARKVDLRVCCATCKDLRGLVATRKFREDLFFRIAAPSVTVAPLRKRPEEIPWLVDRAVRAARSSLAVDASLVEACLLRAWPGNVREILAEVNTAVIAAVAASSAAVGAQHLAEAAGAAIPEARASAPAEAAPAPAAEEGPTEAEVITALVQSGGNVSAAARTLDLHRTQLRRLLVRYSIDPDRLRGIGKR